jgi:uncharacterized membrane protein YgcG
MISTRFKPLLVHTVCAAAFALGSLSAFAYVDVPNPAPVVDLTGTLDVPQKQALTDKLARLDSQSGTEIELLMIPTTGDESVQSYAWRVAEAWRPGHQGLNRGLVVVIAKNDHRSYIQVGRGLEQVITSDAATGVAKNMTPLFRSGDFYGGLDHGVDELASLASSLAPVVPDAASAKPVPAQGIVDASQLPAQAPQPEESSSALVATATTVTDGTSFVFKGIATVALLVIAAAFAHIVFRSIKRSSKSGSQTRRSSSGLASHSSLRPSPPAQSTRSGTTQPYRRATAPTPTPTPTPIPTPAAPAVEPRTSASPTSSNEALFGNDFAMRNSRNARPPSSPTPTATPSVRRSMVDDSNRRPVTNRPVSAPSTPSGFRSRSSSSTTSGSRSNDDGFTAGFVAGSLSASRDSDYYNRNDSYSSPSPSPSPWADSPSPSPSPSPDVGGSFGGSGGGDGWS